MKELLGRTKHARRAADIAGYRNGYGKPRHLAMMNGTVTGTAARARARRTVGESRVATLSAPDAGGRATPVSVKVVVV